MKAAVVGSSGYIAGYLLQRLKEIKEVDTLLRIGRKQDADYLLDLTEAEAFDYSVLQEITYVIFTAAVSSPDLCAADYAGSAGLLEKTGVRRRSISDEVER